MTYYEILEVNENASKDVIHMAYKALCKKYHPDICRGDKKQAEEQMKKINEAYATLFDETKRKRYDAFIKSQTHTRQHSYYQPKQESNVISIDALLKRGFMSLEDGEWSKADHFFELVLNQDAGHAEAYLGKLMVELRVKTKDTLKDCPLPFNDKMNYKRAFYFADDSLKRFLNDTIQFINNRNYEAKCSAVYIRACTLMQQSNDIQGYKDAIAEFEKVREYKDSNKKIEQCYERIAKINSAILATEKNNKEDDKKNDDASASFGGIIPFIRKNAHIILPLFIFVIVVFAAISSRGSDYGSGNIPNSSLNSTTSSTVDSNNSLANTHGSTESNQKQDDISSNQTTKHTNTSSNSNTNAGKPSTATSSSSKPSTTVTNKPDLFGDNNNLVFLNDGIFSYILEKKSNSQVDAIVSACYGNPSTLNIPSTIEGYPITTIGDYAFNDHSSLKAISMPNSVTTIGEYAFRDCSSLTSIKLSNNIKRIEEWAFRNCTSLTSINIPNCVTYLGEFAFSDCSSLKSVTIPNGITSIGRHVFSDCTSLSSVIIPSSITSIGNYAFHNCSSLTSVKIPGSVMEIGEYAFADCSSLSSLTLSNGIKSISVYAFDDCSSLKSVTIPESVTNISYGAFGGCTSLETVYFHTETQKKEFADRFNSGVKLVVLEQK